MRKVVLIFCLMMLLEISPAVAQVSLERAQRGVSAELLDHGDYYLHPNGQRITFLRKKDMYAIEQSPSSKRSKTVSLRQRIENQFGSRVQQIKTHRLGASHVIMLQPQSQRHAKTSGRVTPQMIKSLDSSIMALQPVLANARGSGDLLLTTSMLIKLESDLADSELKQLLEQYGLRLNRRLKTSGAMYSVSAPYNADTAARFALVRQVMNDSRVEWAQPQFKAKPFKTAFEPISNPLYSEQWHLRNTGIEGSRCDTDCDANNAWGIGVADGLEGVPALSGSGAIIAIIDDGIQLDHEDLTIWTNPNETPGNGMDDDNNGYIDDVQGWDFVDDDASAPGSCGEDEIRGPDNDPSPQVFTECITPNGDDVEQDDHGTAVAGLAGANNNNVGIVGTAYSAEILPIRLISEFDADPNNDFCARVVEAMSYAGTYADVINNSWGMEEGTCPALDTVIESIVDGTLADLNDEVTPRRFGKGSPVVFAAGNSASGWVKVTVPVSAGEHAYEWRFLRAAFPIDDFVEDDTVRLDDIRYPDGSTEDFETGLGAFTNECALNECIGCRAGDASACTTWGINTDPDFSRFGNSAEINMQNRQCISSYLNIIKDGPAGNISFWVWVSTDQQVFSDKFEFLIDGQEVTSFGDLPTFVDDAVAYPANLTKAIAVGASDAGDLSGISTADLLAEERVPYSQFGPSLDVLAPSSSQHLSIVTTDRYGPDGEGFNVDEDIGGSALPDPRYTGDFGGTSASAPLVAGIAATMIATDKTITTAQVEEILRSSADKIGRRGLAAYDQDGNTRSDFYGYGRVNMFRALKTVLGVNDPDSTVCDAEVFSYTPLSDLILPSVAPQIDEFCPAQGPLPADDPLCVVIRAENGNIISFCL